MTAYIALIVEGQTEQACLEVLLQRVWRAISGANDQLRVVSVVRGKRDRLVQGARPDLAAKVGQAVVTLATKSAGEPVAPRLVLLLLDSEGECPKQVAPPLLTAAQAIRPDFPLSCVLACTMFENWLVAGADTLGGVNGLPDTLPAVADCEAVSGAKWLDAQLRGVDPKRKYKKTVDAKPFTQQFNLVTARERSPSFDKLCRELLRLMPSPPPVDTPPAAN